MLEQEKIMLLAEWMGRPDLNWRIWNPYTSSDHSGQLIQHARSLGWHYEIGDNHTMAEYYCLLYKTDGEDRREVWGYGASVNNAICVAFIRLIDKEVG